MAMPRQDLLYYALGRSSAPAKVATFVRERGGLAGVLGAVTNTVQWQNLLDSYAWVNAHPLPDDASADMQQTRTLLLAALVHAQTLLQAGPSAAADAAFNTAMRQYRTFAADMTAKETPSRFALWLAGLGLDFANPLVKAAMLGGVVLVAVVAGPPLVAVVRGRRS